MLLTALSLTDINKPQARTFSWLFHGHKMHLLWAFLQTDRIPSPFIYFNLWKSRPNFAYIWSLKKVCPSRAESPLIGHYKEYPFPPLQMKTYKTLLIFKFATHLEHIKKKKNWPQKILKTEDLNLSSIITKLERIYEETSKAIYL